MPSNQPSSDKEKADNQSKGDKTRKRQSSGTTPPGSKSKKPNTPRSNSPIASSSRSMETRLSEKVKSGATPAMPPPVNLSGLTDAFPDLALLTSNAYHANERVPTFEDQELERSKTPDPSTLSESIPIPNPTLIINKNDQQKPKMTDNEKATAIKNECEEIKKINKGNWMKMSNFPNSVVDKNLSFCKGYKSAMIDIATPAMKEVMSQHNELSISIAKINSRLDGIEHSMKVIQSNIGNPVNIIKSLESKIELLSIHLNTKKDKDYPNMEATKSASMSGTQSIISGPSTSTKRPEFTPPGTILSQDERALMLKNDRESYQIRGIKSEHATWLVKIMSSTNPALSKIRENLSLKLKSKYNMEQLNEKLGPIIQKLREKHLI